MTIPEPITDFLRWNVHRLVVAYALVVAAGSLFLGWPLLVPGLIAAALLLWIIDGIFRPGSSLFHPTVTHGDRGDRRVALTFDDGPDPQVTPAVLDALAEHGAHASFFVIGRALESQPELGRRIAAEGHTLANHSWQHSYWQNFYMPRRHAGELERCERAIAAITGRASSRLYRPPVGLKSGELGRAVAERGLTLVAWSLHGRDTFSSDPVRIARRVLARVRGGDIVLLHDGHHLPGRRRLACAEAVRLILTGLRAKGLECVTLPELLGPRALSARKPLPARPEPLT